MISSRLKGRDSLLFVYGTLRPFVDIPMSRWLRRNSDYLGTASTPGRLFDLGPYPGLRAARDRRERVVGDVYRVRRSRVLRVLDRYEAGNARRTPRYVRVRCCVKLARGGVRKMAWTYRYLGTVASSPRIASGDYREHLARVR